MNLVIIKNRNAVTTSLVVAESFEKRHDHVLRDIEKIQKDVLINEEMFWEGKVKDYYERDRKIYYMSDLGFNLLKTKYTLQKKKTKSGRKTTR